MAGNVGSIIEEIDGIAAAVDLRVGDHSILAVDDLALLAAAVRDLRRDLGIVQHDLVSSLIQSMGDNRRVEIVGLGEIEKKRKTKRTGWDHDALIGAAVARIIDEPVTLFDGESGELLPYAQIGMNVAQRLRECVSFGAGKVTGLHELGLDSDEFCHEEPDGYDVKIPARKAAS